MASNINETNIDELYPVAGVDNDSQGFRDNFSGAKSNFIAAKAEIEALQDNTAKTNEDNNFNGNEISGAVFLYNTDKFYAGGTLANNQNVSLSNGNVQSFGAGGNITLTLSEWPTEGHAKLKLMFVNIGSADKTVSFSVQGGGAIKTDPNWPNPDPSIVVSDSDNFIIVEFFTVNGGTTVYAEYKGLYS